MNRVGRLSAALAPLLALLAAGCVGYRMDPEPLKAPPFAKEPPLALRVAVVEDGEEMRRNWRQRPWLQESDARKLTEGLRYSGLFKEVVSAEPPGPAPNERFDLIVKWTVALKYRVGIFPFLPLCDPLIIGCFMDNTDRATSSVDASVTNAAGAGVKSYHESQTTTLIYKIGSLGKRPLAARASVEHALAQVVQAFLNDRSFYQQLVHAPKDVPAPVASEAEPAVSAAAVSAVPAAASPDTAPNDPAAAAAPAETSPAPKPKPGAKSARRALSPEELRALDEELLP